MKSATRATIEVETDSRSTNSMEDCSTLFQKDFACQGIILLEGEDRNFWQQRQVKSAWKTVNWLLGETKTKCEPFFSAVDYHDFMDKKIDDIKNETESASAPSYTVHGASNLNQFKTIDVDLVTKTIRESPTKHCNLDPIPTRLVIDCASLLGQYITPVVNHSVVEGCFPFQWKYATISLVIKKSGLDDTIPSSYRTVTNLPFLSKVLERCYPQADRRLPG